MDMGTFRGITTLLILIAFIGIVAWAYSKRRKKDFDEAANLPFADDDEMPNRDQASGTEADSRHDRGDKNR
ncbi:cbb3-type cytochrome oxidase subunit 3 [Halomonas salifodinae]|uniref:cbb3-type cytochrome oxidase subunit 3 n=1 Tax=Halomonas salifodinae TaxID=438745 RepID=UPI0033BC40B2